MRMKHVLPELNGIFASRVSKVPSVEITVSVNPAGAPAYTRSALGKHQ
jgi:hypothetical protein